MGRETKILLGLLASLAGVFVGVLSMKLLVPRPPVGAGPDVHVESVATEPHLLVAPPSLSTPAPESGPGDRYRSDSTAFPDGGSSRAATAAVGAVREQPLPRRDPFVTAASLDQPLAPPADRSPASVGMPAGDASPPPAAMPPRDAAAIEPLGKPAETMPTASVVQPAIPAPPSLTHVVASGDSWWDLAERAYGDGRLYRALFAWNRVVDPRVSLTPGTRLEIPPQEKLEAAWPKLMPPR